MPQGITTLLFTTIRFILCATTATITFADTGIM
jgi:hypothetical protein